MPKILHNMATRMAKHMPKDMAWAVATKTLQNKGLLKKGTNKLTKRGRKAK